MTHIVQRHGLSNDGPKATFNRRLVSSTPEPERLVTFDDDDLQIIPEHDVGPGRVPEDGAAELLSETERQKIRQQLDSALIEEALSKNKSLQQHMKTLTSDQRSKVGGKAKASNPPIKPKLLNKDLAVKEKETRSTDVPKKSSMTFTSAWSRDALVTEVKGMVPVTIPVIQNAQQTSVKKPVTQSSQRNISQRTNSKLIQNQSDRTASQSSSGPNTPVETTPNLVERIPSRNVISTENIAQPQQNNPVYLNTQTSTNLSSGINIQQFANNLVQGNAAQNSWANTLAALQRTSESDIAQFQYYLNNEGTGSTSMLPTFSSHEGDGGDTYLRPSPQFSNGKGWGRQNGSTGFSPHSNMSSSNIQPSPSLSTAPFTPLSVGVDSDDPVGDHGDSVHLDTPACSPVRRTKPLPRVASRKVNSSSIVNPSKPGLLMTVGNEPSQKPPELRTILKPTKRKASSSRDNYTSDGYYINQPDGRNLSGDEATPRAATFAPSPYPAVIGKSSQISSSGTSLDPVTPANSATLLNTNQNMNR